MSKNNPQNKPQQGKNEAEQKLEEGKGPDTANDNGGNVDTGADGAKPAGTSVSGEGTAKLDDEGDAGAGGDSGTGDSGAGADAAANAAPVPVETKLEEKVEVVERNGSIAGTDTATGQEATQQQLASAINEKAGKIRGETRVFASIDEAAFQKAEAATPVSFWEGQGLSQQSESQMRRLEEYIDAMNPRRPITIQDGVSQQRALYRLFIWIFNASPEADFKTLVTLLLERFYELRNGVFHESAVGRFPEHLTLNKEEIRTFYNLINLFKIVTDEKGGELRLKQVDMNKTMTEQLTEQGKQRLLALVGK